MNENIEYVDHEVREARHAHEIYRRAIVYPRLVKMLKDLSPHCTDKAWTHIEALLRELGELE